jgi:hypothetical protein
MKGLGKLVLFIVLCLPTGSGAQQKPENAAVKYLRADISLRQTYPLAPDAAVKLERALESPLDGEDEKLVAAANEALVEFNHGTALTRCDWAMSAEDGPLANTSHRGAIKELVAVSGLRARLRFRVQNTQGAINDALASLTAARHLSIDGSIASVLFANKLEDEITGVLAQNLEQISRTQLKELTISLEGLPTGSSLGTAFESEKVRRNDLLAIAEGATTRDELIEHLLSGIPFLQSNKAVAGEIVDGCGGSVKGFLNCVNQQQSSYTSWGSRFGSSPEQFETEYKAEIEALSRANPVSRLMTPHLPRLRWAEAYTQTRRALLYAAIDVRLDGPAALNRHLDPYDKSPFSYTSVNDGFRLESRLKDYQGIALSLTIVPATTDARAAGIRGN